MATRQEMRSFVCGQCHVEYYFKGAEKRLTFPWDKGLRADSMVAYYEANGHKDWIHKRTGAPALKVQHPEFELWSQGIHGMMTHLGIVRYISSDPSIEGSAGLRPDG